MSIDPHQLLVAANRFGLGAAPGDLERAADDPRGSVLAQIGNGPQPPLESVPGFRPLGTSASDFIAMRQFQRAQQRARMAAAEMAKMQPVAMEASPPGRMMGPNGRREPPLPQQILRSEVAALYHRLATTQQSFAERLCLFWANHFAVSVAKSPAVRVTAGAFVREAIRPHVFGRFGDMLKAVEQHPAMLVYLDNFMSIGPKSPVGRRSKRGLNENLAREIMELHTLGVGSGYTQADVTNFARVITGWTIVNPDDDEIYGGRFTFAPDRHEPGPQTIMGKVYREGGIEQGEAVLADFAVHPATARHIARKLAVHFIADNPPPALVDRLTQTFTETRGDLAAVSRTLVSAPEAWSAPMTKMRMPHDFVVAMLRAAGRVPDPGLILHVQQVMGEPLWQPVEPNGFSDLSTVWASPEGMAARLDAASRWGQMNAHLDPNRLLEETLGRAASAATRQAVARAESRAQGLALLFMSPEFQHC